MKKILSIIIFTLSLLVSSCNKVEITEPFELMENDYFFLDVSLDKCDSINFSQKSIVFFNPTGLMNANKEGETTFSLMFENGTTKNIDFVVTKRELKEINEAQNKKYEKDLKAKIKTFTNKIERSNSVVIDKIGQDSVAKIKMRANPLYIEQSNKNTTSIIVKEDGFFYEYEKLRDTEFFTKKDYAKDEDEFNIMYEASYYYFDATKTLEYFFDYKKGNIDYVNGYYFLRGKYEDCLNDEMRNLITSESNLDAETYDLLMNSIVSMYFKFNKNEVIFGATAHLGKGFASVSSTGAFKIKIEDFEPIDLKENVLEKKPSDLDGYVPEVEMVDKPYTFSSDGFPTECVCTTLEEGQYVIKAKDLDATNVNIEVYDENKQLVDARYSSKIKETFYIPKSGKYYLVMKKEITGIITFTISKVNYKTTATKTNPEKLKSGEIEFEGYMDIHYYVYENTTDHNQEISIRNFGKHNVEVIHENSEGVSDKILYYGNGNTFTATPGKNIFIIYDPYETYADKGSMEILIKVTISE